jgi:dTDP-glucose 4,6-dehydratase
MKLLVTGGCGFIGSNFIRNNLRNYPDDQIVNLDALTYAGNLENLSEVSRLTNYQFVRGDISDRELVKGLFEEHRFDIVINFAAESHVDRSIEEPEVFLKTNVMGTQALLDAARQCGVKRFLQVSTDEVYGVCGEGERFRETTPMAPRSPYAASKAAADHLAMAYFHTYELPVIITRCCNNFGPYQFPEKLLPLMIINAYRHRELPVYGDGLQVREWIHVDDHCRAIDAVLANGTPGQIYNVGTGEDVRNIDLVRKLLRMMDRPESLIQHVTDRPGHDRRYAVDASKLCSQIGWEPETSLERGLKDTIDWYLSNRMWWEKIISGEYREYYERMYGKR